MKIRIKIWSENLKGSDHSDDLGINGRIILDWILKKQDVLLAQDKEYGGYGLDSSYAG
jgi:hypothetical protein